MSRPDYESQTADWQGITLSVRYCPNWSDAIARVYGEPLAHLEIQSEGGEGLPITETGYRSHFVSPRSIEEHGGAVDYVIAWLDDEAGKQGWGAAQQLTLGF